MSRDQYSSIINNNAYKNAEKDWGIELDRYHKYWYDLVVYNQDVAEYFDTRKLIYEYLKELKKNVEESLEKRFIYFICSREKVRFNTKIKPSYNPFTRKMKIHILIGKNEKPSTIKCMFFDALSKKPVRPKIILSDKYITIEDSLGNLTTASIHDFLESANIQLGIFNKVEYVGYTKNPHTRPTNGSHTGLSDTLYKISNENLDTLIYFNIFKVTTCAISKKHLFNFTLPNAMTNEINAELEGKLIEKSLILYFDSFSQNRNKEKEYSELKENLSKIKKENNIKSIQFNYEFEEFNEYGIFFSSKTPPKIRHSFTVQNLDDKIDISAGASLFDNSLQNIT